MYLINRRHVDSPKEENVFQVLRLLRKSNLDDNEVQQILDEKRIGFGLNRGYSGAQAAKHLLGLSAANLPTSPGRRRRRAVVLMN
ncbi:unnamed protein product [Medioppia subpectinata]|uniref:Uncharacterized protein n=1 Tax=Medioppia subpectinata TaxID=1979941 RepID=A0A7R9KZJ7_9ACAR|nr:unnamed protein product [Medioppia subpectinata]CAG2112580.1 unnamed protein product [Medioppia subpectinata]